MTINELKLHEVRDLETTEPLEVHLTAGSPLVLMLGDDYLATQIMRDCYEDAISSDGKQVQDRISTRRTYFIPVDPRELEAIYGIGEGTTIQDLYMHATGIGEIVTEYNETNRRIADGEGDQRQLLEHQADLSDFLTFHQLWDVETNIQRIIENLGLAEEGFDLDSNIMESSSGQRIKIFLGMIILSRPELLLLDNIFPHLDPRARQWVSQELAGLTNTRIVMKASHVGSGNEIAKRTVISLAGQGVCINQPPREAIQTFTSQVDHSTRVYEAARQDLKRRRAVNEGRRRNPQFMKSSNAAQAVMAQKSRLDRELAALEQTPAHAITEQLEIRLGPSTFRCEPARHWLCRFEDPISRYPEKIGCAAEGLSFDVSCGERIAIAGSNGSGKSTLLKSLLPHMSTDLEVSGVNLHPQTQVSYFSPDLLFSPELRSEMTLIQYATQGITPETDEYYRVMGILRAWGFDLDDILHRQVRTLGRARKTALLIARMQRDPSNLLILDEITSELRDEEKRHLANVLADYKGAILLISHDPSDYELFGIQQVHNLDEYR